MTAARSLMIIVLARPVATATTALRLCAASGASASVPLSACCCRQSRDAAGPRHTGVVSALGVPRRPERDNAFTARPAAIAFHSP